MVVAREGVLVNLQLVGSVLEGVALAVNLTRELAGLTGGHEAAAQAIGDGRADHEAARLGADDLGDATVREVIGDRIDDGPQGSIKIVLKYVNGKQQPVIAGLKRISKPGLRVYAKSEELPKVLGGLGIAIISTSKGLMTDREARKQMIGGEVLAYIW